MDRNSSTIPDMSTNHVGNGEISEPVLQALTKKLDQMEELMKDSLKRTEDSLKRMEDSMNRMEDMIARALAVRYGPSDLETMPLSQMQWLINDAVSLALRTNSVRLNEPTALQISQMHSTSLQMDEKVRSIDARIALHFGIEASTPGK